MLGIIKALTDVCNYVKELKTYYGLKNQVLYSSTSEWNSGSKTVANITKYQTIKVYPWDGYDGITLERVGSKFQGTGFVTNVSSGSHTSLAFILNVTQQDVVTIGAYSLLHHTKSASHSPLHDGWIKKIVGIEPIIPDALAEYIRGGYCVRLGGGLHAKLKTVLDGHRQFCKERKDYNFSEAEQNVEADRKNHKLFKLQIIKLQRIVGGCSIRRRRNNKPYTSSTYKRFSEQAIRLHIRIKLCLCFFDQNGYSSIQATNRIHSNSISLRQIAPRGCCHV